MAIETHPDPRVRACIYEGTHQWIESTFRHPVRLSISAANARGAAGENKPQPVPYYTVRGCLDCNIEERVYHNCTASEA